MQSISLTGPNGPKSLTDVIRLNLSRNYYHKALLLSGLVYVYSFTMSGTLISVRIENPSNTVAGGYDVYRGSLV